MDDFFQDEDIDMYEDEGPRLEAEAKAFERVGPGGKLAELLSSPAVLESKDKKGREAIAPEDRFLINVDALCRRMNSDGISKITETDINTMLEKTTIIPGLRYKNYIAYVLGYLASQGGKTLKPEQVKLVISKVLPQVAKDGGVEPPDVVRYARYWREFL